MDDEITLDALAEKNLGRESCGLGKFEGNFNCSLARALYNSSMESGFDEQIGAVDEIGWFAKFDLSDLNIKEDGVRVAGAIVNEDDNGFFTVQTFEDIGMMNREWTNIEQDYEEFYKEQGDQTENYG